MNYSDLQLFILIVVVMFMILYIFATFSYQIKNNYLLIKWKILGVIPFISKKIKVEEIENVRKFELNKDLFSSTLVLGNLFFKQGVILVFKKGNSKFRIYLTPDEIEKFIAKINNVI